MTSSDWYALSEIICFPDSEKNNQLPTVNWIYFLMEKLVLLPLTD